jgi:hypothetical protein
MRTSFVVRGFVGALTLLLAACGSSTGSGDCGMVQPCGGDLTGTWQIDTVCADSGSLTNAFQDPQCPTAMAALGPVSVSGTLSFNGDKSYTVTELSSGSIIVTLPPACLTVNGITLNCAQVQQGIETAAAADTPPTFSSVTCSGTTSCTCSMTFPKMVMNDAGTWSTSGTNLTIISTTQGPDSSGYCVQGTELHLITLDMTIPMGSMGTLKIAKDLVARR